MRKWLSVQESLQDPPRATGMAGPHRSEPGAWHHDGRPLATRPAAVQCPILRMLWCHSACCHRVQVSILQPRLGVSLPESGHHRQAEGASESAHLAPKVTLRHHMYGGPNLPVSVMSIL